MSLKVVKLRHRSIALLFIILVIRRRKSRKGETVRWRDSILLCHSATLFAVAWNYYVCVLGETNNLKKRKRAEALAARQGFGHGARVGQCCFSSHAGPNTCQTIPARLNCIRHLLSLIPYKKMPREKVKLPNRKKK